MDHDMSSAMPGMMSSEDMDKLEKASGAEFDKMFLEMMVKHHEGAVEMAETEKADGKYGPAKKLADDVDHGPDRRDRADEQDARQELTRRQKRCGPAVRIAVRPHRCPFPHGRHAGPNKAFANNEVACRWARLVPNGALA